MSEKHPETQNPSPTPQDSSPPSSSDVPVLKRETVVMVNDRGRLGLLVALCSLAGVAVGFGLSSLASGMYAQNCGFHGASSANVRIVSSIESETPPWLGVRITTHRAGGAHVKAVEYDSPAVRAGIRPGDVIVGFTSSHCPKRMQNVGSASDLVRMVRSADLDGPVLVMVKRDGETHTLTARLQHMPRAIYYREIHR